MSPRKTALVRLIVANLNSQSHFVYPMVPAREEVRPPETAWGAPLPSCGAPASPPARRDIVQLSRREAALPGVDERRLSQVAGHDNVADLLSSGCSEHRFLGWVSNRTLFRLDHSRCVCSGRSTTTTPERPEQVPRLSYQAIAVLHNRFFTRSPPAVNRP